MKNKTGKLLKLFTALAAFVGLYLNMEFYKGVPPLYKFMYFTNISNFLALGVYASLCVKPDLSRSKGFLRFKGAVIMAMLVTGIIYNTIFTDGFVTPEVIFSNKKEFGSFLVHAVVPVCVLADWLLFDRKDAYRVYEPFLWVIFPYMYIAFTVAAAQAGQFYPNQATMYPYNFMAWDIYGFSRVMKNIFFLTVFFIALGYLLYFIGYFLNKSKK